MALALPSYATVGASDGSAFVTKAEFDAALSDFNARLTTFEAGINSKIDSQVSSYLDRNGIWQGKDQMFITDGLNHDGTVASTSIKFKWGDFWTLTEKTPAQNYWNVQIWAFGTGLAGNGWSGSKYKIATHKSNRRPIIHANKSGLLAISWSYKYIVSQVINYLGPAFESTTGDNWSYAPTMDQGYLFANNTWVWKHILNLTIGNDIATQKVAMMHTAYNASLDQQEWMHRFWSEYQHLKASGDPAWKYTTADRFAGLLIGDQSPASFVDYIFVAKDDYINFMESDITSSVTNPGMDNRHTEAQEFLEVTFSEAKIY